MCVEEESTLKGTQTCNFQITAYLLNRPRIAVYYVHSHLSTKEQFEWVAGVVKRASRYLFIISQVLSTHSHFRTNSFNCILRLITTQASVKVLRTQ